MNRFNEKVSAVTGMQLALCHCSDIKVIGRRPHARSEILSPPTWKIMVSAAKGGEAWQELAYL